MRVRAEAAPDPQIEPDLAVVTPNADERDVVDLVLRALLHASRHRRFELPGEIAERRIADEAFVRLEQVRRGVDDLVGVDARERASDHVARRVSARFRRRQADPLDLFEDPRHVFDTDPVQLDVLAVGDICDVAAEALRYVCDRAQLLGRQQATGDAHAEHEELVFELLRLGRSGGSGRNAVTALRVQAPPTEARTQVGFVDRTEAVLGIDGLDARAHVETVVILLRSLRGVKWLVVPQRPLPLSALVRARSRRASLAPR